MNREAFQEFITSYYFDGGAFWDSIAWDDSPIYTFCGDMQKNVFLISDNMRKDFGFEKNIVRDLFKEWGDRICKYDQKRFFQSICRIITQKQDEHNFRCQVRNSAGHFVWMNCRGIMRWDEKRALPLFFSGSVSDLESESEVDPISGVLRYSVALRDLERLLTQKKNALVLGVGLNYYSFVNTSNGRLAADTMLRDIFLRLLERFGRELIFYRIDGLRFIALRGEELAGRMTLEHLAREIKDIVRSAYQEKDVYVDHPCSIGYIRYPEEGSNAFELIENVLGTINEAKSSPESSYMLFSEEIARKRQKKAEMLLGLNECVDNGFADFRIVVQPIVDAQNGAVSKGEVLLRWLYKGENIPPSEFIPMLEKSRLILPTGKWVFEQAVKACKTIIEYIPDFKLSFNVSYIQVTDESFFSFMKNTLEKYKLSGEHMIIELTETHFDSMPEVMLKWLENCKSIGMEFALDDFGNGYSSLNFLFRYPTDIIKIDRGLVQGITESENNLQFLKSIVCACHHAGKIVCAEGVETERELKFMREMQCDFIQGYYFYSPEELDDFYKLLKSERDRERKCSS